MISLFVGLAKELRRNGCTVKVVEGWKTRGRDGTYAPRGLIFHHTASNPIGGNHPALGVVTHGRSDLPGPLSQFLVGRDGTVFIVASGRSNHAGLGGPIKGIPLDSGNSFLLGVECENSGIGEPWLEKQKEAIATLFAVLCDRGEWSPEMIIGHKEYTSRKIDPHGIELGAFRTRVTKRMKTLGQKEKTVWKLTATRNIEGGQKARDRAKAMRLKGWETTLVEAK